MSFYEYMGKKLHFMFGNKALTYISTEGEPAIKQLELEQTEQVKKKLKSDYTMSFIKWWKKLKLQ